MPKVESITVLLGLPGTDEVYLYFEGLKAPIWPYTEKLWAKFSSNCDLTTQYLADNFPGIPVETIDTRTGVVTKPCDVQSISLIESCKVQDMTGLVGKLTTTKRNFP